MFYIRFHHEEFSIADKTNETHYWIHLPQLDLTWVCPFAFTTDIARCSRAKLTLNKLFFLLVAAEAFELYFIFTCKDLFNLNFLLLLQLEDWVSNVKSVVKAVNINYFAGVHCLSIFFIIYLLSLKNLI